MDNHIYDGRVTFPFAVLGIRTYKSALIGLDFLPKGSLEEFSNSAIGHQVRDALFEYLDNPRNSHDVVLASEGTDYQKRVWNAIRDIPLGEVRTYSELALQLNSSPRAIANACRRNKIPILIPCHRVIGKNNLGGYFGETKGDMLAAKIWLLEHEGINIDELFN